MKNGKKPTVRQCNIMKANGLDPSQWLVVKFLDDRMVVVNRATKEQLTLNY